MTSAAQRTTPDVDESVSAGTVRIGSIRGNREDGFTAVDDADQVIDTFVTLDAARRAVFERHKGEDRRG